MKNTRTRIMRRINHADPSLKFPDHQGHIQRVHHNVERTFDASFRDGSDIIHAIDATSDLDDRIRGYGVRVLRVLPSGLLLRVGPDQSDDLRISEIIKYNRS